MDYVSTKNAPDAIGPYSQAVKANGMLFTSGQIAIDPATNTVKAVTIEEQRFAKISRRLLRPPAQQWIRL